MQTFNLTLTHSDGRAIIEYVDFPVKDRTLFEKSLKRSFNAQIIYNILVFANFDDGHSWDYLEDINFYDDITLSSSILDYIEPEYYYTTLQRQELHKIQAYYRKIYTPNGYPYSALETGVFTLEWEKLMNMCKNFLFDEDASASSLMDYGLAMYPNIDLIQSYFRNIPYSEEEQLKYIIEQSHDWDTIWDTLIELEKLELGFGYAYGIAKDIVLHSQRTALQKSLAWQIWVKHDKEHALDWLKNCGHKIDSELLKLIQSANF